MITKMVIDAINKNEDKGNGFVVPIGVSARHIHLTQEHVEALFGEGYQLTKKKDLMGGQFASNETVTIVGLKLRAIENVRILGPVRSKSQVEVSATDAIKLGMKVPVRMSGDLAGSAPIAIVGPKGAIYLKEGCIVAMRHIHMAPKDAQAAGVHDGDIVSVKEDNDRGTIVGRRSFGKGLVQQPIDFSDGSAIRLTIARYYTPSGRCIQRPYENGKDSKYEMDWITRYEHGEFFSKDSIKLDENLRYSTGLGRPVYGGGGIMPDVFVPQDTTGVSSYLIEVSNKGLILQFSFQYTDRNRAKLSEYDNEEDLLKYLRHQSIVEQFVRFADSKGVKRRNLLIQKSYKLLERSLYGNIIYNILGREQYIRYINQSDATVKKALDILERGEAFPKAPEATPIIEDTKDDGKEKRTAQAGSFVEDPTQLFRYASVC